MLPALMIWLAVCLLFAGIGVVTMRSKKPAGFWANISAPTEEQISDCRAFNRAVGWLWVGFAVVFALLGLPLLAGQNSPWVVLTVVGSFFCIIGMMIIYLKIESRYKKRSGRR